MKAALFTAEQSAAGFSWRSKAGAWFGLGAAPGVLLIGSMMAARHEGPVPLLSLVIGIGLLAALLWTQGLGGLLPPVGNGATFTEMTSSYFHPVTRRLISGLLALTMVGWYGFNLGLGGAALATLLGAPGYVGPLLIGLPILLLSVGGIARWNVLATITTGAAVALVLLVVINLADRSLPVTPLLGHPVHVLSDVAGIIGYLGAFCLRAADFTAGLRSRRDLAWCVGLLGGALLIVVLAGVGLQRSTDSTDLVGVLASDRGLPAGNLLVAAATIAPAFTSVFSGGLALGAATGLPQKQAMGAVSIVGLLLAVLRFDRMLGPWLNIIAATLPPLVIPMAAEGARRRAGHAPRLVPAWIWLTATPVSLGLALIGSPYAILTGMILSGLLTWLWRPATGVSSSKFVS